MWKTFLFFQSFIVSQLRLSISDVITDKSDYSEDLIGEEDREKDLEKIVNEDDDERVEDHEKEDLLGKKGAKKGKNEEG